MGLVLTCRECGREFVVDEGAYRALGEGITIPPKRCPTCLDRWQNRPATASVVERKLLREYSPVAVKLPADWFKLFRPEERDKPILRAIVKGSTLHDGASWSGRIDIYAYGPSLPSVARVRVMEVTHAAGQVREERIKNVEMAVPGVSLSHPGQPSTVVRREYSPTYQYLALEPAQGEPVAELVFARVRYKTTLKGFGRQYHASLDISRALWAVRLSSSARSGRFGTYAAIAIVDRDHPVFGRVWGDIQAEYAWPADAVRPGERAAAEQ